MFSPKTGELSCPSRCCVWYPQSFNAAPDLGFTNTKLCITTIKLKCCTVYSLHFHMTPKKERRTLVLFLITHLCRIYGISQQVCQTVYMIWCTFLLLCKAITIFSFPGLHEICSILSGNVATQSHLAGILALNISHYLVSAAGFVNNNLLLRNRMKPI
jgi:hypothetical protein